MPHDARVHASRRWRAAATALLAATLGIGLGSTPANALGTDSTPPPSPTGAPELPPADEPISCPTGMTPTLMTAPSTMARPPRPGAAPQTPSPAPTTLADGRTVTPSCAVAPPTPMVGPKIAPEHTVGGARLVEPGVIFNASATVPAPPDSPAVSYVIADMGTGKILAAKAPHALLLPASTLKALTALTMLPRLHPATVVTATPAEVAAQGTRVGLVAGNPYTVEQLFQGTILVSGNDSAYALADAFGGKQATLAAMNAAAARLGAWDTQVVDPAGLDEPGQRSSAYDLALIGRAAMRLPAYRAYAVQRQTPFPGGTDSSGKVFAPFNIQNHNKLLWNYDGTIGVKNGYTSGARHTFIGAVARGGRTLLLAEMGSVDTGWKPSAAMFDWGFAYADQVAAVGALVEPGTAPQPPEWLGGSARVTTPTTTESASPASGTLGAVPGPVALGPSGTVVDARTRSSSPWPWLAGGALLFILLAGAALRADGAGRRRRPTTWWG